MRPPNSPERSTVAGPEILLTQPSLRVQAWTDALHRAGYQPRHWPLTELSLHPALDLAELRRRIEHSVWTLLPSPGAVSLLMQRFVQSGLSWPEGSGIGLVGPGSLQTLQSWMNRVAGLAQAPLCWPASPPYDAQALLALAPLHRLEHQPVLLLHRADGSTGWIRELVARGARLEVRALYQQRAVPVPEAECAWMVRSAQAHHRVPAAVASRSAGETLLKVADSLGAAAWLCDQAVFTQHPAIAMALSGLGYRSVHVHEPGVGAFMRLLRTIESRPSRPS